MIFFLYILSTLAIAQGVVTLLDGIRAARYLRRGARRSAGVRLPSVVVFCPCKGVDPEFEDNIRSILGQDYPDYKVTFIVESASDAAYALLLQVGAKDVLVAGNATDCGQKVHNLQFAVRLADAGAETYVFCDSDARFPRGWLRRLVAPLSDPDVAVTTGYRWYVSRRFHLPTLLRSAWNATVVSMLGDHGRNFAWGGSMAMRRETFERLRIAEAWSGSVSDDYAVTRATQQHGARILFVPSCLIPSFGECSFKELLEFTTRQITITRVYHPRLWWIGLIGQTIFNLTFLTLTVSLLFVPLAIPLWVAIYSLAAAKSAVRYLAVRAVLGDPSLSRFSWFYMLCSPIVSLLYQYNMVCSALTSDIEWRQIHYKLISPNRTLVRRSSADAS